MEVSTELVTIESGGQLDAKLATGGYYPPQIGTADLPAYADVEGMLVYDTTLNKLVVATAAGWETITSST